MENANGVIKKLTSAERSYYLDSKSGQGRQGDIVWPYVSFLLCEMAD